MEIEWMGPRGGLGNRILGLASVKALAKLLDCKMVFPWILNPSCNANFHQLFEDMPGLKIDNSISENIERNWSNDWEPLIIYREFKEYTGEDISLKDYYTSFIQEIRSLRYNQSVLYHVEKYYNNKRMQNNLAVHIRRTDRIRHHKASFKGVFTTDTTKFKYNFSIIKNTGLYKTLQYAVLPEQISQQIEIMHLVRKCRRFVKRNQSASYTIYADSSDLVKEFQLAMSKHIGAREAYVPSYCNRGDISAWGTFGKRSTSAEDALIELLGMARSAGILQNNSASTFSICSSIIGGSPILTPQPKHQFWTSFKNKMSTYPYAF